MAYAHMAYAPGPMAHGVGLQPLGLQAHMVYGSGLWHMAVLLGLWQWHKCYVHGLYIICRWALALGLCMWHVAECQ